MRTSKKDGPAMMPLITVPNMDQYFSDSSIILNGTAKKGIVGPPIGVLDIGVSKVAYFFRVALPGVRKDYCMILFVPSFFFPFLVLKHAGLFMV